MESENEIEKLKTIAMKKGTQTFLPKNGEEILVIKEEKMKDDYFNYAIAVGNAIVINTRYFEVKGKVYSPTLKQFSDSVLRIEPKQIKQTKGVEYFCSSFKAGLIRAIDEASWVDNLKDVSDLIDVLDNFGEGSLKSMFDDLKTNE
jgi:hypothetical protein